MTHNGVDFWGMDKKFLVDDSGDNGKSIIDFCKVRLTPRALSIVDTSPKAPLILSEVDRRRMTLRQQSFELRKRKREEEVEVRLKICDHCYCKVVCDSVVFYLPQESGGVVEVRLKICDCCYFVLDSVKFYGGSMILPHKNCTAICDSAVLYLSQELDGATAATSPQPFDVDDIKTHALSKTGVFALMHEPFTSQHHISSIYQACT
eukprot:SAG11_NODE_7701_length_1108_cov_1.124876_2_plen_206_part_00